MKPQISTPVSPTSKVARIRRNFVMKSDKNSFKKKKCTRKSSKNGLSALLSNSNGDFLQNSGMSGKRYRHKFNNNNHNVEGDSVEDDTSDDDIYDFHKKPTVQHDLTSSNSSKRKISIPVVGDQDSDSDLMPSFLRDGYDSTLYSDDTSSSDDYNVQHPKSSKSSKTRTKMKSNAKKAVAFDIPKRNAIILVLEHPTNITLLGCALIKVFSGTVTVLGYDIDSEKDKFFPVFSSMKLNCLQLETKVGGSWRSTSYLHFLKEKLSQIAPSDIACKILESCRKTSVVICLKRCQRRCDIGFVLSYFPYIFPLKVTSDDKYIKIFEKYGFSVGSTECEAIEISPSHEEAADTIVSRIHLSRVHDSPAPRIILFGKRGLGKSTALRFFINKVLNIYEKVYFLDGDIGQSEFTPPGCVSLIEVTEPLLGPPFTHLKKPLRSVFLGNVSVDGCPQMYDNCVTEIFNFYNSNFSSEPLFINTMGWIKGIGGRCLDNMIFLVEPTILIELVESDAEFDGNYRSEEIENDQPQLKITIPGCEIRLDNFPAAIRRSLSIAAYFGQCQPFFDSIKSFQEFKPYCVSIDNIAVYDVNQVFVEDIVLPLNCCLVALCSVEEEQILLIEDETIRTIQKDSISNILGFGFVRCTNKKKILNIITPESIETLQQINVIIKGNVAFPEEILKKQTLYGIPIPYTQQTVTDEPSFVGKKSRSRRSQSRQTK